MSCVIWNGVISSLCELGDFPGFLAGQNRRDQKGRCKSQQFGSSLCQDLSKTLSEIWCFLHFFKSQNVSRLKKHRCFFCRSWICASAPCIPCTAASWRTRSAMARRRDSGEKMGWNEKDVGKCSPDYWGFVGLFDICLLCSVCLASSLVREFASLISLIVFCFGCWKIACRCGFVSSLNPLWWPFFCDSHFVNVNTVQISAEIFWK